jgi:anti-anti-sigma regulatory factor
VRPTASSITKEGAVVIAPVFCPPSTIDASNIDDFDRDIVLLVAQHHGVVIDCSGLVFIGRAGVRVLARAARETTITLVNPRPIVRLMAAVFELDADLHDATPFAPATAPS